MEQERRQWPRIRPTQLVYVELGADNGGMVRDVSETGIGFCAVSGVACGEKVNFVFTPDGQRRLKGNAQPAWTDETGKVGGLRFLEVSNEFRGELHSWLRLNNVPAGPAAQFAPSAAMDTLEQPPPEPLSEPLNPAKEGPSRSLRANAMRLAAESAAPARQAEPVPEKPPDTFVLSYADGESIRPDVDPGLPIPAFIAQASEAPPRRDTHVFRAAGAVFVVMLLVILFLFRQGAGEGLVWLGQRIAGEPRSLPVRQSDGQVQKPSPTAESSNVDTHKEQETALEKKSISAPMATTVPGPDTVAPARTSGPSVTREVPSGPQAAAKKGSSEAGSHPEAMRPKVVTRDKAATVRLLWAEVAKGGISAEVALADLYVRGDSVPKNCAQARVLLSAAAKKGSEIAVRKLIDLDSEGGGCSNSARQ